LSLHESTLHLCGGQVSRLFFQRLFTSKSQKRPLKGSVNITNARAVSDES